VQTPEWFLASLELPWYPVPSTQSDWNLLYSSDAHGCCLKTMYRKVYHSGPVIIVAMDSHGYVFGGFASEDIRVSAGASLMDVVPTALAC
jgi:hypothetical protein